MWLKHEEVPQLKKGEYPVLAPSRIRAAGGKFRGLDGSPGHTTNITEIEDPMNIVEQYRNSARLAKLAKFDSLELLSQE